MQAVGPKNGCSGKCCGVAQVRNVERSQWDADDDVASNVTGSLAAMVAVEDTTWESGTALTSTWLRHERNVW